jgi:hypothetical protein
MGVEWHPVENSKLASAGASSNPNAFLDNLQYGAFCRLGWSHQVLGLSDKYLHAQAYVRPDIKITRTSSFCSCAV